MIFGTPVIQGAYMDMHQCQIHVYGFSVEMTPENVFRRCALLSCDSEYMHEYVILGPFQKIFCFSIIIPQIYDILWHFES